MPTPTAVWTRPSARAREATDAERAVLRAGLWTLLAAKLLAQWGVQWDIQWHLLIGRDSFWIAPHVMTYTGVGVAVLVSFGVLGWTTLRSLTRSVEAPGTVRVLGLRGTPGFHVAAWGIALTVLAAPIDDLWHRLFGLDVTLWSPPHLLGLFGGIVNSAACILIAREAYGAGVARLAAIALAGAQVFDALGSALRPSLRIAYLHGGVGFYTYAILATLLIPPALVLIARAAELRLAPVLVVLLSVALGLVGVQISRAGFRALQPVSVIEEAIAQDPTSPIAVTHEIARKNGATVGRMGVTVLWLGAVPALALALADPRRRPVRASVAYGATSLVTTAVVLARQPAFRDLVPSAGPTVVAAALVLAVALLAGGAVRGFAGGATGRRP